MSSIDAQMGIICAASVACDTIMDSYYKGLVANGTIESLDDELLEALHWAYQNLAQLKQIMKQYREQYDEVESNSIAKLPLAQPVINEIMQKVPAAKKRLTQLAKDSHQACDQAINLMNMRLKKYGKEIFPVLENHE